MENTNLLLDTFKNNLINKMNELKNKIKKLELENSKLKNKKLQEPDWSLFDKTKYSNISAHDLAREFYRSQHPNIIERARNDRKFHNTIDTFLGYPNQNLCLRR